MMSGGYWVGAYEAGTGESVHCHENAWCWIAFGVYYTYRHISLFVIALVCWICCVVRLHWVGIYLCW